MEDVHTAAASEAPSAETYRHLRAAAESGWDFSSRWLREPSHLSSIHTGDILPVDLNCLLYFLEKPKIVNTQNEKLFWYKWLHNLLLNIIKRFIASLELNLRLGRVNWYEPSIESWKIPTIELLLAGLII